MLQFAVELTPHDGIEPLSRKGGMQMDWSLFAIAAFILLWAVASFLMTHKYLKTGKAVYKTRSYTKTVFREQDPTAFHFIILAYIAFGLLMTACAVGAFLGAIGLIDF